MQRGEETLQSAVVSPPSNESGKVLLKRSSLKELLAIFFLSIISNQQNSARMNNALANQ